MLVANGDRLRLVGAGARVGEVSAGASRGVDGELREFEQRSSDDDVRKSDEPPHPTARPHMTRCVRSRATHRSEGNNDEMPVERAHDHPTFELGGNAVTSLAAPGRGATEAA